MLKVIKFHLLPPTRLSTVVKNIFGAHHGPPPMSNNVKTGLLFKMSSIMTIREHTYHYDLKKILWLPRYDRTHTSKASKAQKYGCNPLC